MRLRRLVEVKPSGKCHVDDTVRADYNNPERREWLELALVDAIRKYGPDRVHFKKIRVPLSNWVTHLIESDWSQVSEAKCPSRLPRLSF